MIKAHRGKSIVVLAVLAGALCAAPARAADDGQASLISGLASTFGLTKQDDPDIDYRERSKIVLPPQDGAAAARAAPPRPTRPGRPTSRSRATAR